MSERNWSTSDLTYPDTSSSLPLFTSVFFVSLFSCFLYFSPFLFTSVSWRGGEQTMKRKKMRVLISCVEISFGKNQTSGDSLFLWIHLHHRRSNHDIRTVTKLSEERKKWRIDRIMWEGQRVKKVGRGRERKKKWMLVERILSTRGVLSIEADENFSREWISIIIVVNDKSGDTHIKPFLSCTTCKEGSEEGEG